MWFRTSLYQHQWRIKYITMIFSMSCAWGELVSLTLLNFQILGLNPQLRGMLDSNSQLREMMQNPEFLRQLTSPETMQVHKYKVMQLLTHTLVQSLSLMCTRIHTHPHACANTSTKPFPHLGTLSCAHLCEHIYVYCWYAFKVASCY